MNNSPRGIAGRLRRHIDHDDTFTSGHQIITIRRTDRDDPEWTKSDEEIRKVLLRAFPKLDTDSKQRLRAGRWMRVIQLYFRKHYTHGQIAAETEMKYGTTVSLIRAIKRVADGRRADGSGVLGNPKGRPKKHAISETDSEGRATI